MIDKGLAHLLSNWKDRYARLPRDLRLQPLVRKYRRIGSVLRSLPKRLFFDLREANPAEFGHPIDGFRWRESESNRRIRTPCRSEKKSLQKLRNIFSDVKKSRKIEIFSVWRAISILAEKYHFSLLHEQSAAKRSALIHSETAEEKYRYFCPSLCILKGDEKRKRKKSSKYMMMIMMMMMSQPTRIK